MQIVLTRSDLRFKYKSEADYIPLFKLPNFEFGIYDWSHDSERGYLDFKINGYRDTMLGWYTLYWGEILTIIVDQSYFIDQYKFTLSHSKKLGIGDYETTTKVYDLYVYKNRLYNFKEVTPIFSIRKKSKWSWFKHKNK